ncbi:MULTISPECIES: DUF1345 domain-containing protein [Dyella]|uniref:DUF1345 domain-containing protein n=2 Tax=Dyella TaxID=231454 RepID=A0A4R0YVJ9_9GAMM|nr:MULTISPECIES: DUF1345 domain-containing protein [Dyella]TBR38944.1 DUF1345 domain-containing protein [Dyella terrae]TCI13465.1 DUF1345 domain-containing protein [Dyella soli]
MGDSTAKPASRAHFRYLRARPRLMISIAIMVAALGTMIALHMRPILALLLAFDMAALVYLILLATLFNEATPDDMRSQARTQDTGRWGFLWAAILVTGVVMVSLGVELHDDRNGGTLAIALAAISIVLAWLFMNTMFALHYAHGYYGDYGKQHEGLDFPKTPEPDYWDFAYFAIVIGMTFQVSDVQITSRYLRRVALLHSVIAFFFNVFIIALSVNVVAGKA